MNPKLITWLVLILVFGITGIRVYLENKKEVKEMILKIKSFLNKRKHGNKQ